MLAKKKVRTKRIKKHSESEISPLNSTEHNDETPYDEEESISFDIIYDDVPSKTNEPEVNKENETAKTAICANITSKN